jgi:hypothetical protein
VPGRGDVVHAVQTAMPRVRYVEKRAADASATRRRLEDRQARTEHRPGRNDLSWAAQRRDARVAETPALARADAVAALIGWRRQDVRAVRGPDDASRGAWYDWMVAERRLREAHGPRTIRPVRCLLENQRDSVRAFAQGLDQDLQALAEECAVPGTLVEEVRHVLSRARNRPQRWQREQALWQRWGERYGVVRAAVAELLGQVVRASSVIENLNSRLRCYCFRRRQLGGDYLALVPFFLNQRRCLRREHPARAGKRGHPGLVLGQSP